MARLGTTPLYSPAPPSSLRILKKHCAAPPYAVAPGIPLVCIRVLTTLRGYVHIMAVVEDAMPHPKSSNTPGSRPAA